ncbi:MAG: hypothetical protein GWO07_06135 [Candidatus Dadabacteria bacterium]|nr:hypothetical protein [Candidatus Dadabacteria bacterium]NIS08331.1 hypothetical protein [Candidatus Dadabacteria bacterium]NIV41755.1 hypothetical protein [Candidatus Dadabacteria bacterium]NIX15203.1 hypothetical protein [Candidatus Dadabacteria bacterium]NIY21848.1 hypothetical protein [Candidatus Dadabacteria bacterium]
MSILGLFITSAILILVGMEGMICIVLAFPISLFLTLLGAAFGYVIQDLVWDIYKKQNLTILTIFILPLILGVESTLELKPALIKVQSSIIINASKEIVWKEVIASELPPPNELIFKTGIAYHIKAEIDGRGVGVIRYRVFSTGKLVAPIEVWDEPEFLQFSVTHSPPPMKELSIYPKVNPPHLDGFLKSQKGRFR